MDSRERVLRAFSFDDVDRVPLNYMSNSGIHRRLLERLGIAPGPDSDEALLKALGVDFRGVHAPYTGPRLHPEIPGRRVDPRWGIRTCWVEHESGGYWEYCDFPLRDATVEDIERWPMPSPDDFGYDEVPRRCERHKGRAIFVGDPGLGDILNSTGMIRGTEQVMLDLALEDEAFLLYVDRKLRIQVEILARTLEAAKGRVDIVWMGEDLGSQDRPLISLDMYRRLIRPRHQKYIDAAKSFGCKVMIHCCGSSSWAFEDFIEMGVDIVDTLQPEAKDMAPAHLKQRFGGRLAFHGCISTAGPLATGSVEDVRRTVRETLDIMLPGGGYALAPTHQIQDNTPTENAVAMYEAAKELSARD